MPLELSEFQKTYIYETRAPVAEVLADLKALGELDARAERRRRAQWLAAWLLMAFSVAGCALLSVVVAQLSSAKQDTWGGLPALVAAASFAAGIVLFIIRSRAGRTDLDNRRYGLVATLLKRFQVDLDANAPVDVKLDLAPVDEARKCVGKPKRGRWECEDFTDAWLSLHGRFADGTHLHLSAVEHLQKRKRYGRSRSGKTKLKTKRKGKTLLQVGLRVKPERFPGLAGLGANAKRAAKLPPGVALSRLDVAGDRLSMRVLLDREWSVVTTKPAPPKGKTPKGVVPPATQDAARAATMMLLSLYQVLGTTRRRNTAPGREQPL
ncbi:MULTISPECIES: hypothetical protein [unclassified Corallococcus]|uniref:hypothetical protein n=1 Tax=unclassified Corallococcus TaxID=2685029 RepID=UPI001A8EBB86|nr:MULTISPECIES: hypothetical protein [unclassified Corallococcus]MBN9681195.1 hypothetical protein [Corallococcus sp. NCSPR001]WAS87224.1 hypothetical protein O0N60_09650 [Corallococcus sp. NCRR]